MHTCRGGCLGVFRVSSLATREYGPLSIKSPPGRQYAADFTKMPYNGLVLLGYPLRGVKTITYWAHRGPALGRALRSEKVPGSIPAAVEQREIGVALVLSACTPVGVVAWELSEFPPMRQVNTAHSGPDLPKLGQTFIWGTLHIRI